MSSNSTKSNILTLTNFLDRPSLRMALRFLSGYCEKDNDSRLKVALELLVGTREDACFTCAHVVTPLVKFFIKQLLNTINISKAEFLKTFRDPYWLRGLTSTIRGVAKYGTRKPFTPGAPYLVVWDFTNKCNLDCKHCYANAGTKAPDELTTEEALNVVEKLADFGVTAIAFSGGEPFARDDFFKILKKAHKYGIYTTIATNGTLLSKEKAEKLAEIIPTSDQGYVEISIDGVTAESHDSFRGVSGAFDRAVQGIKNAKEAGLYVGIATTVTQENFDEVDGIVQLADDLDVERVILFNFVPTGRGKQMIEHDLTPQQREQLLYKLMEWNNDEELSLEVESTAPQLARVAYQLAKEGDSEEVTISTHMENAEVPTDLAEIAQFIGGCGAGRMYFGLRPNGDITPCVFIEKRIANIFDIDLQEFWDTYPLFWLMRDKDLLKAPCGECEYRYVCGGCRARAYGYFHDFREADIGCIYTTEKWQAYKNSSKEKAKKAQSTPIQHP